MQQAHSLRKILEAKDAGWNVENGAIRIMMTGTASDAGKYQDHMYSKGRRSGWTRKKMIYALFESLHFQFRISGSSWPFLSSEI